MRRNCFFAGLTLAINFVLALPGFSEAHALQATPQDQAIYDADHYGDAMDRLAKDEEEWGTMEMSAPLLVETSTNFSFSLQYGTTNYFNDAKSSVQAATASFTQQLQSFSGALQLQTSNPGSNVTALLSTNAAGQTNIVPVNTNFLNTFSSNQLTPYLGLLNSVQGSSPTLNNRAALNITAGDQTTEGIFNLLGNPAKAADFLGKKILLGVVTVSINPGTRTQKGYNADMGVLPKFEARPARLSVVKRLLKDTNCPLEMKAALMFSYRLNDDDTRVAIKWSTLHDDLINASASNAAKAKGMRDKIKASQNSQDELQKEQDELKHAQAGRKTWRETPDDCKIKALQTRIDALKQDIDKREGDCSNFLSGLSERIPENLATNRPGSEFPVTMAVSPLTDVNTTDEASSQRSQSDFALSLAAMFEKAGLQGQASVLENYAKRQEKDARSRNAIAAINAYSGDGIFGWQVGSSLNASAGEDGKAENLLSRQTFPSLIMVGFLPEDIYPQLAFDHEGKLRVYETAITFTTIPKWTPNKHFRWWKDQGRFSERERLEASIKMKEAQPFLDDIKKRNFTGTAYLAERRTYALKFVFGTEYGQLMDPQKTVPLPDNPTPPSITGIYPASIVLQSDSSGKPVPSANTFAILGNGLKAIQTANLSTSNILTGDVTSLAVIKPATNLLNDVILLSGVVNSNAPIVFCFPWSITNADGSIISNNTYAPKVTVVFNRDTNAPLPLLDMVQTPALVTNALGTNLSSDLTVKIAPAASSNALQAAVAIIVNEINRLKPVTNDANVSVQVEANQKK